jgi:hypothetical protein
LAAAEPDESAAEQIAGPTGITETEPIGDIKRY